MQGTVATEATVAADVPPYSQRLADALDRAKISVRGLARLLADREGGATETKRRNIYKWLDEDVEPEPVRAGLLAILLNEPELAVLSPRRSAGRLEDRLEALAVEVARLLDSQSEVHAKLDKIQDDLGGGVQPQRDDPKPDPRL